MVSIKNAFLIAITVASADAFAPSPRYSEVLSQTTLRAINNNENDIIDFSRRQILEKTFAVGAAFLTAPQIASADPLTTDAWALSIQASTHSLSQSLGHALIVIDGLNAQAKRLGSSPHPAHPIAVLDGMNAQARRLTSDLDRSAVVLNTIKDQARQLTPSDESFRTLVGDIAHASSVLDGLVAQSRRLVSASSSGGSTDDQIVYMLSVLDGLNAQARRLDVSETFSLLDELNAKAARQN